MIDHEKFHATTNYTLGAAGVSSPWWLDFLKESEFWMHYLTVAGGFVLLAIQIYRTISKNKKED